MNPTVYAQIDACRANSGYVRGVVSQPNIIFNTGSSAYMSAPSGSVFRVSSLSATAAWNNGATATFTGRNSTGGVVGTVTATVSTTGPVQVDLTPLGYISSLEWVGSGGTAGCVDGGEFVAIDNIAFTGKWGLLQG